jgi:hypothetical protein
MKKREAEFCVELQKWLKYNMPYSFMWEAKVVDCAKKKNYAYKSDKSFAKELGTLKLAGKQVIHKFSDFSRMGTICDGFKVHNACGYFFIKFIRRGNKEFYRIEVSDLEKYILTNNPKSISEEICKEIGVVETLK